MRDRIYLVLSNNKVERMTKNPPSLEANEIYISLKVNVLDEVFKRPVFWGEINVSDNGNGFDLDIKEMEQTIERLRKGEVE